MRFEWDEDKNRTNLAKHGISFEAATWVFEDPFRVSVLDQSENEERWRTVGSAGGVVLLLVVHTTSDQDGQEVIRIISARKATAAERKRYEEDDA